MKAILIISFTLLIHVSSYSQQGFVYTQPEIREDGWMSENPAPYTLSALEALRRIEKGAYAEWAGDLLRKLKIN